MKNTKICPKCGCSDIIVIEGHTGPYGVGNNIPVGMTIWSYANVTRYLCASCGYSEEWVDKEYIERIRKKYGEAKK